MKHPLNGDLIPLRVEALKLAYETAHKIGGFRSMAEYSMKGSSHNLLQDIDDVFKLADMNLAYLLGSTSRGEENK